jgi:integrase
MVRTGATSTSSSRSVSATAALSVGLDRGRGPAGHDRDVDGVGARRQLLRHQIRRRPTGAGEFCELRDQPQRRHEVAAVPVHPYLTHQQVAALAKAAGDHRPLILVLAYTGLRWSEVIGLKAGRVDLLRRRLRIAETLTDVDGHFTWGAPKNHQARDVVMPGFVAHALAPMLAGLAPGDLVFTNKAGTPLRNQGFRRAVFDAAAKAAGVPLTPHELRHTAASLAVASRGCEGRAGDARSQDRDMTLDVYAHLFGDNLDAVADRMGAAAQAALADVHGRCTTGEVVHLPSARSGR